MSHEQQEISHLSRPIILARQSLIEGIHKVQDMIPRSPIILAQKVDPGVPIILAQKKVPKIPIIVTGEVRQRASDRIQRPVKHFIRYGRED